MKLEPIMAEKTQSKPVLGIFLAPLQYFFFFFFFFLQRTFACVEKCRGRILGKIVFLEIKNRIT